MMQAFTRTELRWIQQGLAVAMEQYQEEMKGLYKYSAEYELLQIRVDAYSSIRDRIHDAIVTGAKRIAVK